VPDELREEFDHVGFDGDLGVHAAKMDGGAPGHIGIVECGVAAAIFPRERDGERPHALVAPLHMAATMLVESSPALRKPP